MFKFYQADIPQDRQRIQELFTEFLQWGYAYYFQKFGIGTDADVQNMVGNWMAELDKFCPPNGVLMVAAVDTKIVGVGCLGCLGEEIGHIRHFYVQPQFRRRGIGRKILESLVEQSREMGHKKIWLDTAWFMDTAQALYHSVGFRDIDPYPGTEVPEELHPYWIFMKKDLTTDI